jgi:hypothetical protein
MHELKSAFGCASREQFLPHVVFPSLDVMIDARFDRLHCGCGELARFARQLLRTAAHGRGEHCVR